MNRSSFIHRGASGRCLSITALLVAMLVIACRAPRASAQFSTIELTAVSKMSGRAGSEFDLRSSAGGGHLEEVGELRFSHPGISSELLTDDPLPFSEERQSRYGHFHVKIADSVPPGRYEVRTVGRHGVSNARAFLVHALTGGDLEAEPSQSQQQPTPLPTDTVYHAKMPGAQVHYFALHVDAGKSLRVDCLAAQLDSRAIPVLTLMDSSGRILQTKRGSDSIDPRLVIESDESIDYVLGVHDAIYRGGADFGYQLVVQPDATAVNLISPSGQASEGQIPIAWLPSAASGFAGLGEGCIDIEETSDAKAITPPCTLHASFDSPRDEDVYEFSANEGDQFAIDLVSQRLGQPSDCRIVIQRAEPQESADPKWHQVLAEDDSQNIGDAVFKLHTTDPLALFKAPATATYRLVIRDLDTGQSLSREQEYFVSLKRPMPRFDLVAYRPYPSKDPNASRQFGSHLFRGGTESVRVYCLRRDGWTGQIELNVEGLPAGVSCASATIGANQNQTQLTIVADENAAAAVSQLKVIGRGTIDGKEQTVAAVPAMIQWGRGHMREFVRSRLTTDLVIAVSDKDVSPISIELGDGKVATVKKGESLTLPIKLTRREGGKAACVLRPRDLPPTVTSGDVTIAADKSEGNVVFKVPANATAGTYSLWMQSETKIKNKPNPQALERAQAYRAHLKSLSEDPANADRREAIDAAIKVADGRIEAAKGSAKERELTIYPPSPHATIHIVDSP